MEKGLTDDDFGKMLFLKRVLGDRSGLANPLGHNPATAEKQLFFLKKNLGEENYKLLEDSVQEFQALYKNDVLKPAYESGLIRDETYADLVNSDNVYGTFQVNKHILEGFVSPKILHQVGTLDDIANPLAATVMKMVAFRRATTMNNSNKDIKEWIEKFYSDEIQEAKVNHKTGYVKPAPIGMGIIKIRDNGKLRAFYVDEYIEKSITTSPQDVSILVQKTIGFINSRYFRPVFISLNAGFQSFNLVRDFTRSWKALPGSSLYSVAKNYYKAIKPATERARGRQNELITELENEKILGLTYNDILMGADEELSQTEVMLKKYNILKPEKKVSLVLRPIMRLFEEIRAIGDIIETIPKVSAYEYLKAKGDRHPKDISNFIRSRVGTPDFTRKGATYSVYNNLFLFSNIIKEGYRADYKTAFKDPTTRSGYWYKTAKRSILPKLLMFLVASGLLGEKAKELMDKATEYDKTNYTVVPIGEDETGKAIYFRIPEDETGRLIGAITWKLLNIHSQESALTALSDIVSYAGGQIPSLTPTLSIPLKFKDMLEGQNPKDDFRQRDILTDDEMKAGGWTKWQPFLMWTFNQLGLSRVDVRDRVKNYTTFQQVVNYTPVLNRWIRVSDYGLSENLRKVTAPIEKQEAKARLTKKEALIEKANRWFNGDKDFEKLYNELVKDVYTGQEVDKAALNRLKKDLATRIIAGKGDPELNALIYAQTKEQQKAILKEILKDKTKQEKIDLANVLVTSKIVSVKTWNSAMED
jgi:hypothetical protein